ncbi:MAG: STAS domain-containing protein [Rhodospirillaceae bacterium]|nr:STAS domain-containing protein [Rhodospirillaceae bacterium]
MSDLVISVSQSDGKVPVTVMHVSGDIDANSHQELDAKAAEIIAGGAKHILLDLAQNTYMSSAGFRSMHKIYTALQADDSSGSGLRLLKPSAEVKRLMEAMGFDEYIPTHDDINEAVNAF